MTFGEAIEALKQGKRIARKGWNGKNMYLYLLQMTGYDPCVIMRTAQGSLQPGWLASQADMLSNDWEIV